MTSNFATPGTGARFRPGMILARQDRITVWPLPTAYLFVLGMGFIFTFYDIFDINVSFIQTCTQIAPGCTPANASNYIGLPTLLNLVGYVIGALSLTSVADRFGRRNTMLLTLAITGFGALLSGLSTNIVFFNFTRFLTGIGIGADLAVVNTYIGEMAPTVGRARFTSLIFINSSIGAFLGIWLGLLLTTPPAPFPLGLPFALAGPNFQGIGWRWMYFTATILCALGIALRTLLPESSRWLVSTDQLEKADAIVSRMEDIASRKQELPPVTREVHVHHEEQMGYGEIFSNPQYVKRMLLLLAVWLLGYVTVYTISAGFTSIMASLGYPPPEAGLIAAIGVFGFIACTIFAALFGERLERKYWLPIGAVVTLIGGILIAISPPGQPHQIPWGHFIGAFILFFGFNMWVPMTYAWSAENFPTRARVTGFGIVDGVGHIGGGIGLLAIAPILPLIGVLPSFLLIAGFLIAAAIIAQFGVNTRGKALEDVSP
jgi:MFS transporter, putative metabolite:H+ symporter